MGSDVRRGSDVDSGIRRQSNVQGNFDGDSDVRGGGNLTGTLM